MPYFESKGTFLYYEDAGSGPPLIFVPPPGLGGGTFYKQQQALQADYRVIIFDPRGNGKSEDGSEDDYTIRGVAADVLALADHLKLGTVIVCGYSMGGQAAQEFAISYQDRTAGLILIGSFPEVSTRFLSLKIKAGEWAADNDLRGLLARALSFSHTWNPRNRKKIARSLKENNPDLLKALYKNGRFYRSTERLPSLKCPVVTIFGSLDVLVHPYQKLFEERVPNLMKVKINGVAHQVPTRAADELNSVIRSFKSAFVSGMKEEETERLGAG
ncbi:alpha/beta fold hydrolase [Alteribacter natronophilus]|uniref:alpha/beta fold hydrolase n=1 Tax=Alteribacter natronophilus TaxID=2583810 RepID=UPI00110E2C8F|nr:alpha/beta hydrolase [Alteribacter natronophilus]TMW72779.1 alpha/beta hydrolase [Alteribacter natronophilus]